MAKVYNTKEYRELKRVTSFMDAVIKKKLLKYAKTHKISMSKATEEIVGKFFNE